MTALTAKAALVDPAALEDGDGVIATRVPRSEIEEALETGTTSELFLDVAREREGEREAEHRITVSWEPAELEKLLGSTTGDDVTFAFKADELSRMFDEPDVEAQGLRERMAILTVAATTAAGIGAGVAGAMPANLVSESGGGGGTTAAFVTDTTSSGPAAEAGSGAFVTDATSSGPRASTDEGTVSSFVTDTTSSAGSPVEALTPAQQLAAIEATGESSSGQFLTDATSSGPQQSTEAASSGGGGQSFIESRGGEAALAGGLVLLILGAGFIGSRQRRGPQPA